MNNSDIIQKFGRLYHVTPDMFKVGIHHLLGEANAKRFQGLKKVADVCCGSGMMTVPLAGVVSKVVAVDIDPHHAKLVEENAIIAGVEGKIDVVIGDILDDNVLEKLDGVDAIYTDPEWGIIPGDGHRHVKDIKNTKPPTDILFERFSTITDNIAIRLTKEINLSSFEDFPPHEIEKAHLDGIFKFYTVYFGELMRKDGLSNLEIKTS